MSPNDRKLIAVIGATGQQGGGVVRALQASGQFKVRALSRNPGKHCQLADVKGDFSGKAAVTGLAATGRFRHLDFERG
jgi:uncharacterized protein YbjT (DUF2867 family)